RIGSKATCFKEDGNVSRNIHLIDLKSLLQDDKCIYSTQVDVQYFDTDDYELLKNWSLCLCSSKNIKLSDGLDQSFNTLVDNPINAQTLIAEIFQNHSLKRYVIDSLKRYQSMMDIIDILPLSKCLLENTSQQSEQQAKIQNFLDIVLTITKSVLLITTNESMSFESQRYFGNFIKKNDLPIPFAYYIWNQQKNYIDYKINFNLLAETMCSTNCPYILQVGSRSTMGLGKTSMLQFIFTDKRMKALNTDGSSSLRDGCIDAVFPSDTVGQKNETYVIFDVHGTINSFNEDIITSIQEFCSLQILYVTKEDLNSKFLNSMMNYSKNIQTKPTVVVIFDPNYDDKRYQAEEVINAFQLEYQSWKYVKWVTAPPAILWQQYDSNKTNKDLARSQRLLKSLNESVKNTDTKMQKQIRCTSIFTIQSYYFTVKTSTNVSPPHNCRFEIENKLEQLFNSLTDQTENLRIATPVIYLNSMIKQCERELSENWDAPQTEVQTRKENLIQERSNIKTINSYTRFFIDLLTKHSYIELLITEKYLEKWRSKFQPTLIGQLTNAKKEALDLNTEIKRLEEFLKSEKNLNSTNKTAFQQKLSQTKLTFKNQHKYLSAVNEKLMNVDLTIGLFCDEIMELYEFTPHLFVSPNLIEDLARSLVNLMLKGFAIHILRGRPLHCYSGLIKKSLGFVGTTKKPPLVLTVIGEQSSAKSSLMNTAFGCNFRVSSGRCTIGIYMSIIHWRSETIVIFDTEGLLSLEEAGSIFDNQMVTMAMLSSHLILINHKGEFNSNLKDLIGMSFYAKVNIQSPIKPKLFFVLRDQADLHSKATFFQQLTLLKTQLQNDIKILDCSIDDELDIQNENVYLLPTAFSHIKNPITNATQCIRCDTFPSEIIKLRDIIFDNITKTTKPQRLQLEKNIRSTTVTTGLNNPQTLSIDPAYADMIQLYTKISSNWSAIDRLGPKLLECKTLYELSIRNRLQMIANDIITKSNVTTHQDGEQLIDQSLLNLSKSNFIDTNRDRIIDQFNAQLSSIVMKAITQAHISFDNKTEESCYPPEIKAKVSSHLEPPIRSAHYLLKQMFEGRLNDLLKKVRVDMAQKQLLDSVQKEFDQKKILLLDDVINRLETNFKSIVEQHHKNLQSAFKTPETIRQKILEFYNHQLPEMQCKKSEKSKKNIFNLLHQFKTETEYKQHLQKYEKHLSESGRQLRNPAAKPSSFWKGFKSLFTGSSDEYSDSIWMKLKDNLEWFSNNSEVSKNKKIFTEIWDTVIRKFEEDIFTLIKSTKSLSSNTRNIQHLFQFIENAIHSQSIISNYDRLEIHILCSDLAVIGLNILINEAIAKEKSEYESNLQNSTNEIKECKDNLLKQYTAMKDSFELGQTLAETIGIQIIDEIIKLLERRIIKEIREEIFRSQFINHEAIQQQAYEQSINQANGENILKYVYDINRYFIELSLSEIKIAARTITHKHTLSLQSLISSALNGANTFVQEKTHENTEELKNGIRQTLIDLSNLELTGSEGAGLYSIFSLNNIVSMPIIDNNLFKKGFSHILIHHQNIAEKVRDITKNLEVEAFQSCKDSILQKLGCQARCPGCGAKCSKQEPHDEEDVEIWQDSNTNHPQNFHFGKKPDSISVKTHEATHHLANAFHGWVYHGLSTPCLELCYQRWTTIGVYVPKTNLLNVAQDSKNDDEDKGETVFPKAKYYNVNHSTWYNDLKQQSTEGNACREIIPPPEQRRAWMVVRHTLVNHFKHVMVDNKEYDNKLYPTNVVSLPADFEPQWKDEDFE
ncbi:unnamed protein product, partial [Adineta ricciae]